MNEGGGLVTYGYEVTNTGNVPLANVDGRVTDDKCPNVVGVMADGFNVGDIDHNNLLTGEGDLFETGGVEAWQFTCAVNILVDTVNTVSVIGTPVQPTPDAAPVGAQAQVEALEVLAPDVTATAQAHVTIIASPTTTVRPSRRPPCRPEPSRHWW